MNKRRLSRIKRKQKKEDRAMDERKQRTKRGREGAYPVYKFVNIRVRAAKKNPSIRCSHA